VAAYRGPPRADEVLAFLRLTLQGWGIHAGGSGAGGGGEGGGGGGGEGGGGSGGGTWAKLSRRIGLAL
jgi:hypothetical protein